MTAACLGDGGYLDAFLAFADLKHQHHVLEVGVGTGQAAVRVRKRVARLVGVDNSADMLALAAARLPGVTLLLADLQQIPVPDASFDRVLARSILSHMTDGVHRACSEFHRVLRPGGMLVIGDVIRLHEERLVLLPEHLVRMLEAAGFMDIRYTTYVVPQVGVRDCTFALASGRRAR